MNGLLSGFYIEGEVGSQLANIKQLQGSDVVWSIPVFVASFLNNPAPLLLYDKIFIDDQIIQPTINFLREDSSLSRQFSNDPKETIVERLGHLLKSEIFKPIKFADLLSTQDITDIRKRATSKMNNNRFKGEVDYLKLVYGDNYALPTPLHFEAMNIELLWQISKKLSNANAKMTILDDCVRGNLYRHKIFEIVQENREREVAKKFLEKLPMYIAGLPEIKLTNVESFIELHRKKAVKRLREIITQISSEINEEKREKLIDRELYKANEAFLKLHSSNLSKINIFGFLLSIGSFIEGLPGIIEGVGFATSAFTSLSTLQEMWKKLAFRQKYDWFVRLKSFAEKQAGYD